MTNQSIPAARMTKKYRVFLPKGSKIINYAVKASGKDCDICEHTPEKRPPKPGYPDVSEEMRVMRVELAEDMDLKDVTIGKTDFTVTGRVIEINACVNSTECRDRAAQLTNEDGSPKYDPLALRAFR